MRAAPGDVRHRLQARAWSATDPRRLHRHRLRRRPARPGTSAELVAAGHRAVRRVRRATRPTSSSPRPTSSPTSYTGRRRRRRPRPLPATPDPTGSASSRWPSRSATSTRGWTSARPTSPRARRGPAGTGIEKDLWPPGRRLHAAHRRRAAPTSPRPARRRHRRAVDRASPNELRPSTRSPTVPRAARRGRHRQGHRRGGDLVAHRPVGLPGQRRRRPDRLRGPASRCCERRTPTLAEQLTTRFAALQELLDRTAPATGSCSYTDLTPGAGQRAVRRRQRARRAARRG